MLTLIKNHIKNHKFWILSFPIALVIVFAFHLRGLPNFIAGFVLGVVGATLDYLVVK